jgi:CheY-like chemotaxis protein
MRKKILIVDDELELLEVTATRLETSGFKVVKAASSEEALKKLRKAKPDLILLDLLLPEMQGEDLCRKLKSSAAYRKIPVILFTASAVRIDEKSKETGADDYILKPFEPEDLLFKIKKYIG